jgi:hypothetical protein
MLLAILICSDPECEHAAEEVGSTLDEFDAVLCADCDCLMQVVALEEAAEEAPVITLRRPAGLPLAA